MNNAKLITVRLIITKVKRNYYIGKNEFSNKSYKIIKNDHIRKLKKQDDVEFYCRKEYGFLWDKLIPVSEEEVLGLGNSEKLSFR